MNRIKTFFVLLVITCSFLTFAPKDSLAQKPKADVFTKPLKAYNPTSKIKSNVVNGMNVNYLEFGQNSKILGVYQQIGEKTWQETGVAKGASSFRFEEVNRDEWSVYLQDISRSTYIQLDLHTKKVMYGGEANQAKRPLYDILNVAVKPPTKPYQPEGKPNIELVNGKNVNYVEFGRNGAQLGVYRQVAAKSWKEIGSAKGAGTFEFREMNRDEWSVYLKDEGRNVAIQLDLHTKKVMYSDARNQQKQPLYEIMNVSAKVNGWLVQEVTFENNGGAKGKFIQKDGKGWIEVDLLDGQTKFNFVEEQRDDWSVYLFDKSRNAHVQLDLHTRIVSFATGTEKKYPIYKIVDAKSVKESEPYTPNTNPTQPTIRPPVPQVFSHVSTKTNTIGNSTILDNRETNNNQNAIVFITPNWKSPYNPTTVGVYWHNDKWRIFNQDRTKNIPEDYRFNVLAYPNAGPNVFVHKATKENIFGSKQHITRIKHPYSDGDRDAKLIVTQNYGDNAKGVYNNHPIGVYYEKGFWTIFNQDMTPMPENAQFNVLILKKSEDVGLKGASLLNHKSTKDKLLKGYQHVSVMENTATNGDSNLLIFITSSWNTSVYNKHNSGVYYHSDKWTVYNCDKEALSENAYFNVLVIDPTKMNNQVIEQKSNTIQKFNNNSINNKTKINN
ncbi:MAG: hypothetical protein R3E32_10395 [Chitinophagales bacterium]